MMADHDLMGLAVPKMDDDSPANMSTVFSDTDVTEALTLTMMGTINFYGNIAQFQVQVQMAPGVLRSQQDQEFCQDLKVYS